MTPANANIQNVQTSPRDTDTSFNYGNLDIDYLEVAEDSADLGKIVFFVNMKDYVGRYAFYTGSSYAGIQIDVDLDGSADYFLTTPNDVYPTGRDALSTDMLHIESGKLVQNCSVETWMSDGFSSSDNWIGWQFDKDCLPFGPRAAVSGYSEWLSASYFDDTPWFTFNTGIVTEVARDKGRPSFTSKTLFRTSDPGTPPKNLVALSPEILKSTVQITCGDGMGSGWVADVELTSSQKSSGYESTIITNHHVVEGCLRARTVTVTDSLGKSQEGYVFANDIENDLAGVLIKSSLPGLNWAGELPAQAWWVGVLGAPRTIYGYLTTGILGLVIKDSKILGLTAPVNPGNSGGPVFDRNGRVLGTVSFKASDSEGLAFAYGTPLLCNRIVICNDSSEIWSSDAVSDPKTDPAEEVQSRLTYLVTQRTLANFSSNVTVLSSTQKAQVRAAVESNPDAEKFICTGIRYENDPLSVNIMVRKRAKAACDYAKRLNPNLSTWFQNKPTQAKSYAGRVLLTVKSPAE